MVAQPDNQNIDQHQLLHPCEIRYMVCPLYFHHMSFSSHLVFEVSRVSPLAYCFEISCGNSCCMYGHLWQVIQYAVECLLFCHYAHHGVFSFAFLKKCACLGRFEAATPLDSEPKQPRNENGRPYVLHRPQKFLGQALWEKIQFWQGILFVCLLFCNAVTFVDSDARDGQQIHHKHTKQK